MTLGFENSNKLEREEQEYVYNFRCQKYYNKVKLPFLNFDLVSHLWFVTLGKVTQLDFICQLYLKILVLCF